jgi:GTP-binding protein Era
MTGFQPKTTPRLLCGMVAIVGRPNVGKSTLLNALVGEKVSITCDKPQTTRHRILGIVNQADSTTATQMIFVDTPGFQRHHKNQLTHRMNETVTQALQSVDVIIWVIECNELTQADEDLAAILPSNIPVVLLINKIDRLKNRNELLPYIATLAEKYPNIAGVVPVSATKGWALEELTKSITRYLPEGEHQFPSDWYTDQSQRALVVERIREKVFRFTGDEIPYGTAVMIEKWENTPRTVHISAAILTTESRHKAILIGKKGARLKEIGQLARHDIEKILDKPVMLNLWVKVREGWENKINVLQELARDLVSFEAPPVEDNVSSTEQG